jgi:hypothetical protein
MHENGPITDRRSALPIVPRVTLVATMIVAFGAPADAQPCNPAVDGTYCATQMYRAPDVSTSARGGMPIVTLGEGLSFGQNEQPATLGAITFGGDGSRCIGLLRRVSCN